VLPPILPAATLFSGETVTTYKSDCSTPASTFNIGDTVCVSISGVPLNSFFPRRAVWQAPDSTIVQTTNITTDPQSDTLLINATFTVGGATVDSRGVWQVIVQNPFFFFPEAVAAFTVTDPANATADLGVTVSAEGTSVAAGSQTVFQIQANNFGPNSASNVQLTDAVPANATFVSFQQLTGPVFTCSSPNVGDTGTTTCTVATLNNGDTATFIATYQVNNGTPTGTVISNTANISSDTFDNHNGAPDSDGNPTPTNNTSTDTATVGNTPCVLTPPANIDVPADTGQAGAVVTYSAPTSTGDCGQTATDPDTGITIPPISCSPASGSFFPAGTTTVICSAQTGAVATFLVTVENPGGLSITLNGANPLTTECGVEFTDPGATAVDANGQSVPVTVTLPGGFVPASPTTGTYTLTYTATEGSNSTSTTRTVNVTDTTAPDITIAGANPFKIEQGTCLPFVDPGASANDSCAGSEPVTRSISGPGGLTSIDTNTAGTYTITYTASDGSHTATATRTVLVGNFPPDEQDLGNSTAPPVVKLIGGDPETGTITAECGTFVDPGAIATTACGSPLTYTETGTVDSHTPGTYTLTYTATDGSLTTSVTRTVIITPDQTAPIITLNGTSPMTVECHTTFTDPGAVAHDACAGDFPATATGTVDANTPGTYTITYTASDPSGHAATPVTRTVNVVDTTPPVINILGANPATVECHTTYTDAGATASDSCDTSSIAVTTTSNDVNVNVPGTYHVTYSAHDATGNTATATRTVVVADTTPPVITTNGQTPSMWPPNHKYQTFSVTNFVTGVSDSCDTGLGVSSVVIEKVTSDEAENGPGSGDTLNDIVIASDCKSVQLRAEREGGGNGRVYTITFKVTDASGNVGRATAKVVVPHNPGETPVDSGVHYTVNGSCP
jgi:uncharacterized repeat protein (TIGR01451 family)